MWSKVTVLMLGVFCCSISARVKAYEMQKCIFCKNAEKVEIIYLQKCSCIKIEAVC